MRRVWLLGAAEGNRSDGRPRGERERARSVVLHEGDLRMTARWVARAVVALSLLALAASGATAEAKTYKLGEYRLPDARIDQLRDRWVNQIESRNAQGTWAPMKYELSNRDLKLMGLPSKRVLLAHRYKRPTAVYPNGRMVTLRTTAGGKSGGGKGGGGSTSAAATPIISFAGTGFFGIRPGA